MNLTEIREEWERNCTPLLVIPVIVDNYPKVFVVVRRKGNLYNLHRYFPVGNNWAPDGLAVEPPAVYNFEELVRNSRTCEFCKAQNVDTQRVGFAGRCCAACLPDARKRIETKGWCD
jgi:hypothetical protein